MDERKVLPPLEITIATRTNGRVSTGFTPLEIKIPNRKSGRLPERHGETDVRKRHRSFLTCPVRKQFSNGAGFTLIELLVVIAIIALLMSILMPALQRVKRQAGTVACQSNLHQWALIWSMYTQDNNGYFPKEVLTWRLIQDYHKERKITLCPTAAKLYTDGARPPLGAWEHTVICNLYVCYLAWARISCKLCLYKVCLGAIILRYEKE